jgi:hypothetical protein
MMTHYLRTSNNKRKILFCIRDVRESNSKEEFRARIKDTFDQALVKVKDELKKEVNGIIEHDDAFITIYDVEDGEFKDEENVMEALRVQIQTLLEDTPLIEARTLTNLWPLTWDMIHEKEMIDYNKLVTVQESLKELKDLLTSRCRDLKNEIKEYGDYIPALEECKDEFITRINQTYTTDEYCKKALLSLFNDEFVDRAISLEKENFGCSIKKYFEYESKDGHNLYSDLISIFKKLDPLDKDRGRIRKSEYKKFLHNSAVERNLYIPTIQESLNAIYNKSYEIINKRKSETPNKAQVLFNYRRIQQSDLDTALLALSTGIGGLATIGGGYCGI